MSVWQTSRGDWRARITREGERVNLGRFETEQEARDAVNAARLLLRPLSSSGVTLITYGQRWLDRRDLRGVRGIRTERSRWSLHIESAPFAFYPLRKLEKKHIALWARQLIHKPRTRIQRDGASVKRWEGDRPISRETAKKILTLLRLCLHEAHEDGLIKANPAAGIKIPQGAPTAPRERFLSQKQIHTVTTDPRIPFRFRAAYMVLIYCGIRLGELKGLRWEDCDLDSEAPRLHIRRSYDGPTKSAHALREVPVPPPPRLALRVLREAEGVRRLRGLVFEADHGGCYSKSYAFMWRKYAPRVGIPSDVRPHDLRHTCASHLLAGTWGVSLRLEEVKAWLGHSSITVTQRYAHHMPENVHDKARRMTNFPDLGAELAE